MAGTGTGSGRPSIASLRAVADARPACGSSSPGTVRPSAGRTAERPLAAVQAVPGTTSIPEQRLHLIDQNGQLLWTNTTPAPGEARHAALDAIWPHGIARQIEAAIGTAAPSMRFVAETGKNAGKRWWDILITPVTAAPFDMARYVVAARDITGDRLGVAARLDDAVRDRMTGLVNRARFLHEIDQLTRGAGAPSPFAVLKIDIDGFRNHNDCLGQDGGDAVLKAFAGRLLRQVRGADTVARIGGDEFGLIFRNIPEGGAAEAVAGRLMMLLGRPFRIDGLNFCCSVSAGLAEFPAAGRSADELCRSAGAALSVAKAAGRGMLVRAKPEFSLAENEHRRMLDRAARALAAGRIHPHYQPKIDLRTGRIVGFEALLRWRSGDGTIAGPARIWAAFADAILACRITDTIVDRVIADLVRWRDQGLMLTVAINLTDADLRRPGFADGLLAKLAAAQIAPSQIEVEVTESVLIGRDPQDLLATLKQLSGAGVRIALDDFGTGHASLTHLKDFPVDIIKIDRSFVANMAADPGDRAIVQAILNLAAALSIEVVAEGVERPADADALEGMGCDLGQGFLFGRAIDARSVPALLMRPLAWQPASVARLCGVAA